MVPKIFYICAYILQVAAAITTVVVEIRTPLNIKIKMAIIAALSVTIFLTYNNPWLIEKVYCFLTQSTTLTSKFIAIPSSGAAPLAVTFRDNSTGIITGRIWNFGDGVKSPASNPTHIYTKPGLYTVTLLVLGSEDSDTKSTSIYVVAPPSPYRERQSPVDRSKGLPRKEVLSKESEKLPQKQETPQPVIQQIIDGGVIDERIILLIKSKLIGCDINRIKAHFSMSWNGNKACVADITMDIRQRGREEKTYLGQGMGISFPNEQPPPSDGEIKYRAIKDFIDNKLY